MTLPALVLFDLDHVLVHYDHQARLTLLADRSGTTTAQVHAALFESGLEAESDLGCWQAQGYADELARRLGAAVTLDDCVAARTASMLDDAGTLRLAHAVARRARVAIFTNNGLYMRDALPTICPALFPLFEDRVRYGAEFGVIKPDPDSYRRCLDTLDAEPRTTLFVDDRLANVHGAMAAGLAAVQFTDTAALARAFAERGLIDTPAIEPVFTASHDHAP